LGCPLTITQNFNDPLVSAGPDPLIAHGASGLDYSGLLTTHDIIVDIATESKHGKEIIWSLKATVDGQTTQKVDVELRIVLMPNCAQVVPSRKEGGGDETYKIWVAELDIKIKYDWVQKWCAVTITNFTKADGSALPSFVYWKDASTTTTTDGDTISAERTYNVYSEDNAVAGLFSPFVYPVKVTITSTPTSGYSINSYVAT
jgi:hypothetical protein